MTALNCLPRLERLFYRSHVNAKEIIPIRIIARQHPFFMPRKSAAHLPIDAPQRRRLPPLLRRAWYGLNQAFRRRIAHLRITPDQFTVLRILLESDKQGITQRQLTQLMSSDPNTVASLLERMEKAGLLRRKPHELDRRAYRIIPHAEGVQRYQQARDIAVSLQTEVLSVLPSSKREEFLKHLSQVAEAITGINGS